MTKQKRWNDHYGEIVHEQSPYHVIDCESCGFVHVLPLPGQAQLAQIYTDEYFSSTKPDYLEQSAKEKRWLDIAHKERYEVFEHYLAADRRTLLDIGCGSGFFLLHGQERGWRVLGLEPSKAAVTWGRKLGLDIVQEYFGPESVQKHGTFDVVHLSQVLEHVPDPLETLTDARKMLNDGGLLCVIVPNDFNPFQKILVRQRGMEKWWISPPHHLNYFNFETLEKCLTATGFHVVHRGTTFPIDLFLLMGQNYVADPELGKNCHEMRMQFELTLEQAGEERLLRALYSSFASLNLGRECVMIAQKRR